MNSVFDAAKSVSIKLVYEKYSNNTINTVRYNTNVKCPFHGDDTKPSMHLYEKTNTFYCFTCKKHGSTIDFVKEATGIVDNFEAAKLICDDFNIPYTIIPANPAYKQYVDVYKWVADFYKCILYTKLCPDVKYFKNRGFENLQEQYDLGYCPSVLIGKGNVVLNLKELILEKFPSINPSILDSYELYDSRGDSIMAGRYVFPIHDSKGNIVAFSGRSLDPNQPKYLNTKETQFFKKRSTLYNYHEAKKYGTIYIVEGYCDALSLIACGHKNVVASMGTSFTQDHLDMLKDKELVLSFDNDKAGKETMLNLILANKDIPFKVLKWDGAKDFNELLMSNKTTLETILDKPSIVSAPEFVINYCKNNYDLSILSEREKLWITTASLIGANDSRYRHKYPVNTLYTPVSFDYYWTIVKRIIKGKRGL